MNRQKISKYTIVIFSVVVTLIANVGCSGFDAALDTQSILNDVSRNDKFDLSDKPECEVDFADYAVDTHLLAFEVYSKANLSFGFNLLSGFLKAFGLNFDMKLGKMILSMHAEETLRPSTSIADVMGEGNSTETEFSFNFDALQFGASAGYYYKTPIFKLTEKTLKSGLSNMRSDLSKVETAWRSKVVWNDDNYEFIIPAGRVAGLRVGDQLALYGIEYIWKAEPCESELLFARKTPDNPLKVVEVVQIEKNSALLRVKQSFTDEEIDIGTVVEPYLLPAGKNETRKLSRAVRVREVLSEKIKVEGSADIDLSIYLREQLESLLNEFSMYARK